MKIKSLLAVALIFAAPAIAAEEIDNNDNYKNEILGGYMSVGTDGDASFSGFNLEYRRHKNKFFAYGGSLSYAYDSFSGNGLNADANLSALDANVMLKIPVSKAYIYGKAGLSITAASFDITGFSNGYYVDTSVSDTDVTPFFGIGLSIPVKDRWLVDISFTRKEPSFDFGYGVKGETTLDSVFVQLGYKF